MKTNVAGRLVMAALFIASPWLLRASVDSDTSSRLAKLEAVVLQQKTQIEKLTAELTAVKANPVLALAPYVSLHTETINLVKGPHIIFEGANVHIRDGSGSTYDGIDPATWTPDLPTSGLGNLIIGYNEISKTDPTVRGGAHCVVIGPGHSYTSVVGLVAGDDNTLKSIASSVVAGSHNVAEGPGSCISGGALNKTTNTAWHQSISGGGYNVTAGGWASSISGGGFNQTLANASHVSGGEHNVASGAWASVVSAGGNNTASGVCSSVSGGSNNTAVEVVSSVSGGWYNSATGPGASISAGHDNIASGGTSSITGGIANTAAGDSSSVSGGSNRTASGDNNWVAGSLLQPN